MFISDCLESDLRRDLQDPRSRDGATDAAKLIGADVRIRRREDGVVEDVESFTSKLKASFFSNSEVPDKRHIPEALERTPQIGVAPQIPEWLGHVVRCRPETAYGVVVRTRSAQHVQPGENAAGG